MTRMRPFLFTAVTLTAIALAGCAAPTPSDAEVSGTLAPIVAADPAGWSVQAWATGEGDPVPLEATRTDADGRFTIDTAAAGENPVLFVEARAVDGSGEATLSAVVTDPSSVTALTLNERTTVAAGAALAQFMGRDAPTGPSPALQNAVGMAANLADPVTGAYAEVLTSAPNGQATSTLAAFTSLGNALGACLLDSSACDRLYGAAGDDVDSAVDAFAAITRDPSADPETIYDVSLAVADDRPGLDTAPAAWTLALLFDGDGTDLAGPGNFAIDPDGNIWINNNYEYNADPQTPVCGSDEMFKFSPTGELLETYSGGGLSGSGFGIEFTADGDLWFSNFGFAAAAPGCPEDEQPPHNSMSLFTYDGEAISPDTGYTAGELSWPQGIEVSADGDVWITSCGNDTVSIYPEGDPAQAVNLGDIGVEQPFDVVDNGEHVFVSGIANNTVAVLNPDGTAVAGSPLSDPGFKNPMGLAMDDDGNVWVANSGTTTLPCPTRPDDAGGPASVSLIDANDLTVSDPFTGGGVTRPWGIATDGDGNVWVANFADQRVSVFCGTEPDTCPRGLDTGDAISPDETGYAFDGLTRNTGIAVDPSGTVWVANNWENVPVQTNPGGHQIVAFIGAAAPVAVAPFTS